MTNLFHAIDDVQCITRCGGIFRQVAVFRRGEELFARHSNGFIRLMSRGDTSAPKVSWLDMEIHKNIALEGGRFNAPMWKEKP